VASFYRITENNPVTVDDFLSHAARGDPRPSGVSEKAWNGTSMFDTLGGARALARRRILAGKPLGHHVARVDLPDQVERERSGRGGYHDVWAPAAELLGYVIGVVPVESDEVL
jgi:hypothetical protein